jgi:hypothetical protein
MEKLWGGRQDRSANMWYGLSQCQVVYAVQRSDDISQQLIEN